MNIEQLKQEFPIFSSNRELVYLDSTATSLTPQPVIDKVHEYYTHYNANVHRGIYKIAEKATEEYEKARGKIASFIQSSSPEQIIFTRGTTESINAIVEGWGEYYIHEGDIIITTLLDHHSNFVPWQQLALRKQANFSVINLNDEGYLDILEDQGTSVSTRKLSRYISNKTKIIALPAVSNVFGTIHPVKKIVASIRAINPEIVIVIDAAQAVPHTGCNVTDWDADVVVFSGHKMLGPTGIGVLWAKEEFLSAMKPFWYGGEMVRNVSVEQTLFQEIPHKFEAGTPHIAGAIGLGAAVDYLNTIGLETIHTHERNLAKTTMCQLQEEFNNKIQILGPVFSESKSGIVSFVFPNVHAHDVAQILDEEGIAVRAGHHCAMPLHKHLNLTASVRASFYLYNSMEDVERLVEGLKKVVKLFL